MPEDVPPMIKGSLNDALKVTDDIETEQNNLVCTNPCSQSSVRYAVN